MSLTIGLTGGLGSGKTAVSNCFKQHSVVIIDADDIVAELNFQPQIKRKISAVLGRSLNGLNEKRQRSIKRKIILNSVRRRRGLEQILHPLVWALIAQKISISQADYCIIAVPLLLECGKQAMFDRVLVIDTPQFYRIKRVQRRSRWSLKEVLMMMSLQVTRGARLSAADDVIHNVGSLAQLSEKVSRLDEQYRALAKERKS